MTQTRSNSFLPPAIIACVMLLLATSSGLVYGYYQLLRWVICGLAIFFALKAYERHRQGWSWGFGLIAVIFNPLAPFYLGRELWGLIDLISAVVFPVGAVLISRTGHEKENPIHDKIRRVWSASIKPSVASIATSAFGLVVIVALCALPILLIAGGLVVGQKILPWLMLASILTLIVDVVILLPMALIRISRQWAGLGLVISSYIFGLTGWFMGLLLTWGLWGGFAVIIGLCFLGVGVVPMAMLATLFKGMWPELGLLALAVVLTFGIRFLGILLAEA